MRQAPNPPAFDLQDPMTAYALTDADPGPAPIEVWDQQRLASLLADVGEAGLRDILRLFLADMPVLQSQLAAAISSGNERAALAVLAEVLDSAEALGLTVLGALVRDLRRGPLAPANPGLLAHEVARIRFIPTVSLASRDYTMRAKLSVLIVDENRTNLALMDMLVRKLPDCVTQLQTDPHMLLANLHRLDYDIAVFAGRMAPIDGIELALRLKGEPRLKDKPILLAVDEADTGIWSRAADAGITEVLGKPINPVDFRARIQSLTGQRDGAGPHVSPWDAPASTPTDTTAREEDYIATLVRVAAVRDRVPPLHSQRMGRFCSILAHNLGLSEDFCRDMLYAAPLHDIGKAGLTDTLLRKSGFLSLQERREMEEHTRIGHAMLKGSRSKVFQKAADIALTHHERWDGSGYPQRLRGEQIPLSGRIAAVADVFDALTSFRTYKTAWSLANAFTYLRDNAGEQFDPACVAAFDSAREEIVAVMRAMPDPDDGTADAA